MILNVFWRLLCLSLEDMSLVQELLEGGLRSILSKVCHVIVVLLHSFLENGKLLHGSLSQSLVILHRCNKCLNSFGDLLAFDGGSLGSLVVEDHLFSLGE